MKSLEPDVSSRPAPCPSRSWLATAWLALATSCAPATQVPASSSTPASTPPSSSNELWCGPVTCPTWLAAEPAITALPLRERCNLLSKILTFQPLSLVGRPLSAYETSQRMGIGSIEGRLAAAVMVREDAQTMGQSWFAAGETCGSGVLVLTPSRTRGEFEDARSVFRLMLTPATPGAVTSFDFELTAEPLTDDAQTGAFTPLRGRVERGGRNAGPDSWSVVVNASVDSADALKE